MGLFYIHNKEGRVIFVGRGNNLKSEITKLFLKQSKRAIKIQERVDKVTYQFSGNELFNRLKYHLELESLKPKYNFKKKKKLTDQQFTHPDFIIQLKGLEIEENAIILIENNEVFGFGYTNLAFKESKI